MTHAHPVTRRRHGRRALGIATVALAAAGLTVATASSPAVADSPPATFVGLVNGNALVQFQEDTPAVFDSLVLISELGGV